MLQMYTESATGVATPVNSPIVFNTRKEQTGITATSGSPSNTVSLNRAGLYMVQFNGVISQTTAASAGVEAQADVANFVGVQMSNNGVAAPEAQTGGVSTGTADAIAVSFSTIVRVRPTCACSGSQNTKLQFDIIGNNATVYFANVVVTKIA